MVNSLVASDTTINNIELDTLNQIIDIWSTNILDKDSGNWRVLFSTARFHQYYFLKMNDPESIKRASVLIEELKNAAPALPETASIIQSQKLIESQ